MFLKIGSPTGSNTPLNSYSLFFLCIGLHPIEALQPFDSCPLRCASRYVSRQFLCSGPDFERVQALQGPVTAKNKRSALDCEGLEDLPLAENLASCLSRNYTHTPKMLTASARTVQISFSQSMFDAFDQPVVRLQCHSSELPHRILGAFCKGMWRPPHVSLDRHLALLAEVEELARAHAHERAARLVFSLLVEQQVRELTMAFLRNFGSNTY